MTLRFFYLLIYLISLPTQAQQFLNVYVWGGEIPKRLIQKFEKETHIKVRFSTYDSNEVLYAKLKAGGKGIYDVILPSAYFVERMRNQGMLEKLNSNELPNKKNTAAIFKNNAYDPHNQYSIPLTWGITGLFHPKQQHLQQWSQLWSNTFKKKLLLLDDAREVFAMGLLSLGYSPNDQNPEHIKQAFFHLNMLLPNIKLFATDNVQSIIIDEDAAQGMAWNGDIFKVQAENANVAFSFPKEGFVIWVDCLAIPKNAPHLKAAHQFINYMLRPDVAREIALQEGHALTNASARKTLPKAIRDSTLIYPPEKILKRGYFQRDVSDSVLQLYRSYWQQLKLSL